VLGLGLGLEYAHCYLLRYEQSTKKTNEHTKDIDQRLGLGLRLRIVLGLVLGLGLEYAHCCLLRYEQSTKN
jgi:predicted RND superfamily exporter protein